MTRTLRRNHRLAWMLIAPTTLLLLLAAWAVSDAGLADADEAQTVNRGGLKGQGAPAAGEAEP